MAISCGNASGTKPSHGSSTEFAPLGRRAHRRKRHLREVVAPVILLRGVSESHHSKLGERFDPKDQLEIKVNRISVPASTRPRYVSRRCPQNGEINAKRSSVRHPLRAGNHRPGYGTQPLLSGSPLHGYGIPPSAISRCVAWRQSRRGLGNRLYRVLLDPSLV
jgi:hypothetical protein